MDFNYEIPELQEFSFGEFAAGITTISDKGENNYIDNGDGGNV